MEYREIKYREMEYQKDRKVELLCEDKYKGYNYYILNLGTHPTAYVEIPKNNKLYGKEYEDINIMVHGGFTYSRNELMGIQSENWFIGWDYAHGGDFLGYDILFNFGYKSNNKKWTTKEMIEECQNVINQIVDLESLV